jgi:enoyl-CoA hydratase
MMSPTLKVDSGVATLTLNSPGRLNAYDEHDLRRFAELLAESEQDDGVRSLIVRGSGRGFCAGADLGFVARICQHPPASRDELLTLSPAAVEALATFPKPTIAAVHGVAYGGGACLALACDIVVASPSARIGLVFTDLGLPGGDSCAVWLLSRRCGSRTAWRLLASAAQLTGKDAKALHLVDYVVDDGGVMFAAQALAADLARRSPSVMRVTKKQVLRWEQSNLSAAQLHALELSEMADAFSSEDLAHALATHRARRTP